MLEDRLGRLADSIEDLTGGIAGGGKQEALLTRIAEGQERLAAALAAPDSGASADAESRMRLRSIDVQLLRILEELSAGRQESMTDLRADLAALTSAIRQMSRGTGRA
jgi:hypothetical protein